MRTFTQTELDEVLAAEREKHESAIAAKQAELETTRRQAAVAVLQERGISIGDEETVDQAIERHRAERHAAIDADYAPKLAEITNSVEPLRAEASTAKNELTDCYIDRDLRQAATAMHAFDPDQVVAHLKPFAKRMGAETIVRDFAPSVLQSASEAVAMLHDSPATWNLFTDTKPPEAGR